MFPYEPVPTQYLDDPGIGLSDRTSVGDIRQPWIELGTEFGVSAFARKALFALGMMRRYVLSANAVLKDLRHSGFLSACGLLGSGVELLDDLRERGTLRAGRIVSRLAGTGGGAPAPGASAALAGLGWTA